jgi:fructosamine-3-kinase
MAETFDRATLAEVVAAHLTTDAESLRFTPIRTGKHNTSYWVDTDQRRFVLRLAPPDETGFLFYEQRMMRQEPALHALIRSRTTIPVAEIVAYDFSRTRIDRDYLLLAALPGMPLSETQTLTPPMLDRTLRHVGQYLRQLHALTAAACLGVDAYGYLGDHHPMQPQPTWFVAFHVMWHKLLDDVVACGAYTHDEAQVLRDLLDQYREHFEHPVTPRLLHMDVWGQNILVHAAALGPDDKHADLKLVVKNHLGVGSFYELLPPSGDIHRVITMSDEPSISLHLLSNDIGCTLRHRFEPETGEVAPFRSGYTNKRCEAEGKSTA